MKVLIQKFFNYIFLNKLFFENFLFYHNSFFFLLKGKKKETNLFCVKDQIV